jgi:hypothetical protein
MPTDAVAAVKGADNVLLLAPSMNRRARELHRDLLTAAARETACVLAVTYRQSPDRWLRDWRRSVGELPARVGVISVSETASTTDAVADERDGAEVWRAVERPTDLTGLGITVSECLKRWHDTTGRIAACFDSLTAFLQYGDLHTVYRFLHVLTSRLRAVGASGHYHLDPGAYDDQTVSQLKSLFDASVELDDGEWRVFKR